VADLLLEHPRALAEKVARVAAGRSVNRADLAGFVSSDFDPFLNHLFAAGKLAPRDAAQVLDGRPGFVWLDEEFAAGEVLGPDAGRALFLVMQGMVADIARPATSTAVHGEIAEVRAAPDLEAWHSVYCEVFGAHPRSQIELAPCSRRARSLR
jgi:hypothetical protein